LKREEEIVKIDPTITGAVIASVVLFLILHYWIEPGKEQRRKKEESLKSLYAPLYTMVIARLHVGKLLTGALNGREIHFGYVGGKEFINDEYMIEFFLSNSSYASNGLIIVMQSYIENVYSDDRNAKLEYTEKLTKLVIREYNLLKKDLKLDHCNSELSTGLPSFIIEMRSESKANVN
jgi:hypothetical protein